MKYYAPSTKSFFAIDVHGLNIPSDSILLSQEQYEALYHGISMCHKEIVICDGVPTLVDKQPEVMSLEVKQNTARHLLEATNSHVMVYFEDGQPLPHEWVTYRKTLREIISGNDIELPLTLPLSDSVATDNQELIGNDVTQNETAVTDVATTVSKPKRTTKKK
jgi:hypothetical protein